MSYHMGGQYSSALQLGEASPVMDSTYTCVVASRDVARLGDPAYVLHKQSVRLDCIALRAQRAELLGLQMFFRTPREYE